MKETKKFPFCIYEEWAPYVPAELRHLTEADWLAKSRANNFAQYFRVNGQRSPAYFRKKDVLAFFKMKFGTVYPESVASLIAAGFEEAEPAAKHRKWGHHG